MTSAGVRSATQDAQPFFQNLDNIPPKVGGRGAIPHIPRVGDRGAQKLVDIISEAGKTYLRTRGEPSDYIYLHAAGLAELASTHPLAADQTPGETLSQVQAAFQTALTYRMGFLRYKGSGKSLEVGQWWIQEFDPGAAPLADRVEMALVKYLLENPAGTISEIDTALCTAFPGSMPPDIELIQLCLESYGTQTPPENGRWSIREQDSPAKRRAEFDKMAAIITKLGQRLGFDIANGETVPPSIQWATSNRQPQYVFYISASAVLGKIILSRQPQPAQAVHDGQDCLWVVSLAVGVLNAQDKLAPHLVRKEPVKDHRSHTSDVQFTGGTGRKTNANCHYLLLEIGK